MKGFIAIAPAEDHLETDAALPNGTECHRVPNDDKAKPCPGDGSIQ